MAYLKSANPAWHARPGFSGLGAMRRRRGMRLAGGLGVATGASSGWVAPFVGGSVVPSGIARSIGPIFGGPSRFLNPLGPLNPGPQGTGASTTNTGAGSTAANVSGSPVPVGYPTSQIYVAPGGAFWEFNGSTWQNVGTPYNVSGGPAPASTTPSITASGTVVPPSPVPAGYPTNMLYTYTDGSVWQYSASIGGWTEIQAPSTTTSMLTSTGVPTGTPTTAPYTDSAGNVWTYNPTTGQWAISVPASAASSGYQSILDWLSTSTLITGVPNWIIAAGAGFAAIKLMNPSGRR
jgi:hypothetical protein